MPRPGQKTLTNALTRRKSKGFLDPTKLLIASVVLVVALYQLVQWIVFPEDTPHSTAISDLHEKHRSGLQVSSSPASITSTQPGTKNIVEHVPVAMDEPDYDANVGPLKGSLQRRQSFQSPLDPELPKWIRDYIQWHRQMREDFPGEELFNNPDAPNVLIRTCLGLCGGLHDRLGQLPWDLYLANQTGRVLFVKWFRPKPIEDFLIPNAFNWSMPPDMEHFDRLQSAKHSITELFDGTDDSHPEAEFWTTQLDRGIERATKGDLKDIKILRHRILGHLNEDVLEDRLKALGETDMMHNTPSFGKLFFLFFHPAPAIEMELEDVYSALNIKPGQYSAVHCRVRHPKAFSKKVGLVKGKWDKYPADKTGLPWEGLTRDFAVETATDALRCAKKKLNEPKEPIYFFSDSNDLVRYLSRELQNKTFVTANRTLLQGNPVDWAALKEVEASNIVAREVDMENAHIDRQKGRSPPAYYGTFVDLFLAINARCMTFGVGFYAVFAAKISGIHCKQLYAEEAWGGSERKAMMAEVCNKR